MKYGLIQLKKLHKVKIIKLEHLLELSVNRKSYPKGF